MTSFLVLLLRSESFGFPHLLCCLSVCPCISIFLLFVQRVNRLHWVIVNEMVRYLRPYKSVLCIRTVPAPLPHPRCRVRTGIRESAPPSAIPALRNFVIWLSFVSVFVVLSIGATRNLFVSLDSPNLRRSQTSQLCLMYRCGARRRPSSSSSRRAPGCHNLSLPAKARGSCLNLQEWRDRSRMNRWCWRCCCLSNKGPIDFIGWNRLWVDLKLWRYRSGIAGGDGELVGKASSSITWSFVGMESCCGTMRAYACLLVWP